MMGYFGEMMGTLLSVVYDCGLSCLGGTAMGAERSPGDDALA